MRQIRHTRCAGTHTLTNKITGATVTFSAPGQSKRDALAYAGESLRRLFRVGGVALQFLDIRDGETPEESEVRIVKEALSFLDVFPVNRDRDFEEELQAWLRMPRWKQLLC
ncbi:MAG: hypothetical protein RBQ99_01655 [Trichlorobacter sp.]|nr:hypothetical protein [Trichlorobacter sp.]